MRRPYFVAPALCCAIGFVGLPAAPTLAQAAQAVPARAPNLLDSIQYDAATRGPLLLIEGPDMRSAIPAAVGKDSLPTLTETIGRRVVVIGRLTTLAPATMRVIEAHPGKPDPYAGLRADEKLKVLLSLLSPAQWELAGSARGIGAQDLNDQQKALFTDLLPEQLVVQRARRVPGDQPNEQRIEVQGDKQEFSPDSARLRLARTANFQFAKEGTDDYNYRATVRPGDAGEEYTLSPIGGGARADRQPDGKDALALGVPVIRTVPSSLKPSQLNFNSGKLRVPVPLDGKLETLGELLAQVAQAARMDLLCDKRVADLPVLLRIAPGQSAQAGEILQALCWSVTGAFRQVGASTFLLTDDIQGIGARFLRLDEWAEEAEQARYKIMRELTSAAAKNDPLSRVKFAPGDPLALPPALLRRSDDADRAGRDNEVNPADLPENLRKVLDWHTGLSAEEGVKFRMDKVRVGTQLTAQYVLPNGAALEVPFAQNIDSQYLQHAGAPAPAPQPAAQTAAPPMPMPPSLKKRVVIANLPNDNNTLTLLVTTVAAKGFTELWLRVPLDAGDAPARLKTALQQGKQAGIQIGAAVFLLRGGGLPQTEDVNVLGETGAQFFARLTAAKPELKPYYAKLTGWQVCNEAEAGMRLTRLAQVPGLCAFALKATAAPGCAGDPGGGDGIPNGGHLGCDVETRLACIRKEGFDPIDAAPYSHNLRLNASLPFFEDEGSEGMWKTLYDFRLTRNKQALAQIYTALHQTAPQLPLYLDDRASCYTDPNTSWHIRWDAPGTIPINPLYWDTSVAREKVNAGSTEPLLNLSGGYGNPASLARALGRVAERAAKQWRGLTLDLSALTPPQTQRMLDGLLTVDR